jgi:hypothetical protein
VYSAVDVGKRRAIPKESLIFDDTTCISGHDDCIRKQGLKTLVRHKARTTSTEAVDSWIIFSKSQTVDWIVGASHDCVQMFNSDHGLQKYFSVKILLQALT